MNVERLRDIANDMELSILNLGELEDLLYRMIERCGKRDKREVSILSLIERNLVVDVKDLKKLWSEFHTLIWERTPDKPPLEAVEE